MPDRPRSEPREAAVEPPVRRRDSQRINIESPVDAGGDERVPSAHTPRPHPPIEEPEEPAEHAPETEPDEGDADTPSDPQRRPPRPGKAPG